MEFDILNFWDRISSRWESRKGFWGTYFFVIVAYFFVTNFFQITILDEYPFTKFVFIPIALLIVLFIAWVLSTNRFFLKFKDHISVGVITIVENDRDKLVMNKIVKKVINKLEDGNSTSIVKFKVLPTNFCDTDKQVNKYHKNYSFMYDLIIRVFVESGNYNSIEKIIISKLSITFRPKGTQSKKRIFFGTVDLMKDINLPVVSRNWEYLTSNSGIDKKKYISNLYHIILYYLGLYSIYTNKYEEALTFMSPLYNKQRAKVKIKKDGNNITLNLNPVQIAEGRLATILLDLFFYAAVKNYQESNVEKALKHFRQLENVLKAHPQEFQQYMNMARYSYELGNINDAIEYTKRMERLKPRSVEVFLNLGFFAILNDDMGQFCEYYTKIYQHRNDSTINWVDVLSFQLKEKEKIGMNQYFDFSIPFIQFVFISDDNKGAFEEAVAEIENDEDMSCLYELGQNILNPKKRQQRRPSKGGKKRKKKRKRRR